MHMHSNKLKFWHQDSSSKQISQRTLSCPRVVDLSTFSWQNSSQQNCIPMRRSKGFWLNWIPWPALILVWLYICKTMKNCRDLIYSEGLSPLWSLCMICVVHRDHIASWGCMDHHTSLRIVHNTAWTRVEWNQMNCSCSTDRTVEHICVVWS